MGKRSTAAEARTHSLRMAAAATTLLGFALSIESAPVTLANKTTEKATVQVQVACALCGVKGVLRQTGKGMIIFYQIIQNSNRLK
jgi:hypothetical protein